MGGLCPERKHEMRILMTGINNSGKTTILYQMKFNQLMQTAPTNGFNMEKIDVQGQQMVIWDIGGQLAVRRFWQYHFQDKDGIIYVIDATHKDNIRAAHDEFEKMMNHDLLDGLPVLIFANQFDPNETMPLAEIIEITGLQRSRGRRWKVQYTQGLSGEGVKQGILWLKKTIDELEEKSLGVYKTWRRVKDIGLNIRDAQRRLFHRIGRLVSHIRRRDVDEQQHIKSKVSKDTSDKIQLEHYLNMLKGRRSQLFEQYKRQHTLMLQGPGELSKLDAENLCKQIDNEMHELFQEIEDVQKRIDEMGSD